MDKQANKQEIIIVPEQQQQQQQQQQSPGNKIVGIIGVGGERVKRDEWSEGAVSSLLEAYERKWVLRNRAKLKGHDWEDVASHVSSRSAFTKSPKTQTQCKNKIESMKKRYRSESTADASSWPLFSRLDLLLRGSGPPPPPPPPPPVPVPAPATTGQNSHGSNGVDGEAKHEDGALNKNISLSDHASDKNNNNNNNNNNNINNNNNNNSMEITSDSSTPALYSEKADKSRSRKTTINKTTRKMKRKIRRDDNDNDNDNDDDNDQELGIAESIRWLAEAVVKSEQARMEAMREIEKMRAEAEAKRAEIDLKRTEIVANTQLEIARIFAGVVGNNNNNNNKPVDSSLRIGRN